MTSRPLEVLPDGMAELRDWALQVPDIVDLAPGGISRKLDGDTSQIRLALVGDGNGRYGEGEPVVQVECWGPGAGDVDDATGAASKLARTFAAAIDQHPLAGVDAGPYSSPDDTTGRQRWILTVRLYTFAD